MPPNQQQRAQLTANQNTTRNAESPHEPSRDALRKRAVASCVRILPTGPLFGVVEPPGSKSITNRALLIAAMADGTSRLTGALASEDTEVMIQSLRNIGVTIKRSVSGCELVVTGLGSAPASEDLPDEPKELFIANSGTTVRFLTAALSAIGGSYVLKGVTRMHQRPIGDLIAAIQPIIDGTIQATSPGQCPPVEIESRGWTGSRLRVAGSVSSQYLSGLMMAASIASSRHKDEIQIDVDGELVSRTYVDMTAAVMRAFGASVTADETSFCVSNRYQAADYHIEPDASAASYFWAAAAITGGKITVRNVTPRSLQGDVGFVDVLEKMGSHVRTDENGITVEGRAYCGVDVDMNTISDTVQTIAMVALFADSPTRVRGVAHNRFKETDRIGDLARECRRLGATVDEHQDGLTIHPLAEEDIAARSDTSPPIRMETYNDHRMAMSLSLAGLKLPNLDIANPSCTGKTYPNYWSDLEALTGHPHFWTPAEITK